MNRQIAMMLCLCAGLSSSTSSMHAQAQSVTVTLTGRVTDGYGCPLTGATVTIATEGQNGAVLGKATTDEHGVYRVEPLPRPPDIVRLVASLQGFKSAQMRTILSHGQNLWDVGLELGYTVDTKMNRIDGRVASRANQALADATVTLHSAVDPTRSMQTRTDRQGRFSFDVIAPGQYVAVATARDYEAMSSAVTIYHAGETKHVEFALPTCDRCAELRKSP